MTILENVRMGVRSSAVLACVLAVGCSTVQVRRLAADEVSDVSGRWNDTDSRLVAEEMIQDSLSSPWLDAAQRSNGAPPTVVVRAVRNMSMEHINTDMLVEDLQRALINSGRVQFVASAEEREGLRQERMDQDVHASDDTRKAHGDEIGADFVLSGAVTSVIDREGGQSVVFYQVTLKLLDVQTNRIAWSGQKKIKKAISRSRVGL